MIDIVLFQSGCSDQDKWKAVPLQIKKQESFNYSEVISGKLDSTEKAELEAVKKIVSKDKKSLKEDQSEIKSRDTNIIDTIWKTINNIYNWFINLF